MVWVPILQTAKTWYLRALETICDWDVSLKTVKEYGSFGVQLISPGHSVFFRPEFLSGKLQCPVFGK